MKVSGKIIKRDFSVEMLNKYQDLQLLDYGLVYHGDANFLQDDMVIKNNLDRINDANISI